MAATEKPAVWPLVRAWLSGCVVIDGGERICRVRKHNEGSLKSAHDPPLLVGRMIEGQAFRSVRASIGDWPAGKGCARPKRYG